jgi:hypothetical protein
MEQRFDPACRDAYYQARDHILEQSELSNPRYRLAVEQAARMSVLVALLYQYLGRQLSEDGTEPPTILKQIATYENSLNRMLMGLGMTLQVDRRRFVQPETITDYLIRAQEADAAEAVDGGNGQDTSTD